MKKVIKQLLNYQRKDSQKLLWRQLPKTLRSYRKKENKIALEFKKALEAQNFQAARAIIKTQKLNLSWSSAAYPYCAMGYFLNSLGDPHYKEYDFLYLEIFSDILNQGYPIYSGYTKYKSLIAAQENIHYQENLSPPASGVSGVSKGKSKKDKIYPGVDLIWLILRKTTLDCEIKKQFIFYLLDNGFKVEKVFLPHIKKVINFIVIFEPLQDEEGKRNAQVYGEIFERLLDAGFDPNASIEEEFGTRALKANDTSPLDVAAISFSKPVIDKLLRYGAKLKYPWHEPHKISSLMYIEEQKTIIKEKQLLESQVDILSLDTGFDKFEIDMPSAFEEPQRRTKERPTQEEEEEKENTGEKGSQDSEGSKTSSSLSSWTGARGSDYVFKL